jgi:delta 1-pyrroline-5-carboxylate dehydrogenase
MANARHVEKVRSYLDGAPGDDVTVMGTDRGPVPAVGFYVSPAVLTGVAQDSRYFQEEIFGPVLTVQPFDTEAEAISMANGTPYGLAAGLQTTDIGWAHRVADALRAGIVWINGWTKMDVSMPFGGYDQSGYGRENGPEGLDEYLQTIGGHLALDRDCQIHALATGHRPTARLNPAASRRSERNTTLQPPHRARPIVAVYPPIVAMHQRCPPPPARVSRDSSSSALRLTMGRLLQLDRAPSSVSTG